MATTDGEPLVNEIATPTRCAKSRLMRRAGAWTRRTRLAGKLAMVLAVAAGAAGIATYAAWTAAGPQGPNPRVVLALLIVDLVLLLLLGALIARQLTRLWVERRSGSAGSKLHVRLVALFSVVAVVPAIVTVVFSVLLFHLGVQTWFSERVHTAVRESLAVADAYLAEHRNVIRGDALAMANDLNRAAPNLARRPQLFNSILQTQAALRSLSEATVFDSTGRVIARTSLSLAAAFDRVPLSVIDRAREGELLILGKEGEDSVYALIRLDRFIDAYLYVGRFVDPVVLGHAERTRNVFSEYETLEGMRSDIQVTSVLIFIVVALLLLVVAVWLGLHFATTIVRPIAGLVMATERVRDGDLTAVVPITGPDDEIGTLSRAFNRMTRQLASQREDLVEANRKLDRRRRFTEAVLSGVSAGVIGADRDGRINLPNRSAADLLETDLEEMSGRRLDEVAPELAALLEEARNRPGRVVERQITLIRGARRRTLYVRVDTDRAPARDHGGFIITFDDISELVTAQRTAAWADVARRIAHEIKNPLTPIQLSAERLKRKYSKQIQTDHEVFTRCTDTIIRHVGEIGRMVDEFSAFARMPAPVIRRADLAELVRQSVFTRQVAHGGIEFALALPEGAVAVDCDGRQIGQALTNVLKNAAEAIEGRGDDAAGSALGRVDVALVADAETVTIEIADNGRGLPEDERERLTEPYVTTRKEGSGLGLAITQKIVEDHGGRLALDDREGGGAVVRVVLPRRRAARTESDGNDNLTEMDGVAHGS